MKWIRRWTRRRSGWLILAAMIILAAIAIPAAGTGHKKPHKKHPLMISGQVIPIEKLPMDEILKVIKSKVLVDDLDTVRGQTSIQNLAQRSLVIEKTGTWTILTASATPIAIPNGGFGGSLVVKGVPSILVEVEIHTSILVDAPNGVGRVGFFLYWNGVQVGELGGLLHHIYAFGLPADFAVAHGGASSILIPSSAVKNGANTWEVRYTAEIVGGTTIDLAGSSGVPTARALFLELPSTTQTKDYVPNQVITF